MVAKIDKKCIIFAIISNILGLGKPVFFIASWLEYGHVNDVTICFKG